MLSSWASSALLLAASSWLAAGPAAAAPPADPAIAKYAALAKAGNGVIKLNDQLFDEMTSSIGQKNYSVSIVLTALEPQFKCSPCRAFDPEYRLLARQWAKRPAAVRDTHFFANLDFMDGRAVFQRLGLNSAPTVRLHLPNTGPRASLSKDPIYYDFNRGGQGALLAEQFHTFVTSQGSLPHFFRRPPNYAKLGGAIASAIGIVAAAVFAWPVVSGFLGNRYLWAAATLPFILLMISGQMWNEIRSPPYMSANQDGSVSYFAGGYSNQYRVETQIIAGLYGVLAFTAYTLAFTVGKLEDPGRQRVAIYVWGGMLLVLASVLVNVFRIKNGGYPFKLLF